MIYRQILLNKTLIYLLINIFIKPSFFLLCLKSADVTPLHKKGRKDSKQNYRSVSILPTLSKIYERSMSIQMSSFFEDIFSKHQFGFGKGFSTQQCLLTLLKKWENVIDKGKIFGTLPTHLSEAFDYLKHELVITKLNVYGFILSLICNYLRNRKQRVRVNDLYVLW